MKSMRDTRRSFAWRSTIAALAAASGAQLLACSHYVTVERAPVVNLRSFPVIAVFDFEVSEGHPISDELTHRIIATMQGAQPGVRVLRLGPEGKALKELGVAGWTPEAMAALRQKHRVDAMLKGRLDVSSPRPRVEAGNLSLRSLNASLDVDGALRAELHETSSGTMVWTNGARGTWTLASVGVGGVLGVRVGVADPVDRYRAMLSELISVTTRDFRPTYVRQRVK